MTTCLALTVKDQQIELDVVAGSKVFQGVQADYLAELHQALQKMDEGLADNFALQLGNLVPVQDENDFSFLGGEDFFEDDEEGEGAESGGKSISAEEDPVKVLKLIQKTTSKKPKGAYQGCLVDSGKDTTVFECWDEDEDRGVPIPGFVLALTKTRTMWKEDDTRPSCWSRDARVNRSGMLCRQCPFDPALKNKNNPCSDQIMVVFLSADFQHLYKIPFSGTSLGDGYTLGKSIQQLGKGLSGIPPFGRVAKLTCIKKENKKGSWLAPKITLTSEEPSEASFKVAKLFAQMYKGFLKRQAEYLLALHKEYKENQKNPNKQIGAPSTDASPGVSGDFFSGDGPSPASQPDIPQVDINNM